MINYHNPENITKILIPSSLKPFTGLENSTTRYADKIGKNMMKEDTNIVKRANEIIANEIITLKRIIITNKQLWMSGIKMYKNVYNEKLTIRKEEYRYVHKAS